MGQLPYRQRKGLSTAKDRITGQEDDRPGKLYVALRFEVPGFQLRKVILAWTNLRLSAEGNAPTIAKAIDDGDGSAVLPAGVIADIDDESFEGSKITSNPVKCGSQTSLFDPFQLKDANVAKFLGPAVVKHPSLGLPRLTEPVADKSLLGRLEELLDISLCKFAMESGFFLWVEISRLLMSASLGLQFDMPVIQRVEHLAEDIKKVVVAGLLCNFWSVRVVLLFPVDMPQLEKWISVVERIPQRFEILFWVANHDGDLNYSADAASGREIGHQLYKEFRAGKLDSVNFQSAPTDEAKHASYLLWGLEAALAAFEETQADGQDAETQNNDGQMNCRKRELLLLLPNIDDRSEQAGQKAHQASGICRSQRGCWRASSSAGGADSGYAIEISALA